MPESQKTLKARALPVLASVGFWGGLSVLASMTSLALPWWGINITNPNSFSWGVLSGPVQPPLVTFFSDRLDQWFSANYAFMTSLVVLTSLLTAVGSYVKRWPLLTIAVLSSVATDLFFIANVGIALDSECQATDVAPASCISGLVGLGRTSQGSIITWGFKTGFYVFVASGVLLLAALALQRAKSREG